MPETGNTPLTPAQLAASLAGLLHRPYSDDDTVGAAALTAETMRYLNHAAPRDGITTPATVARVAAELTATAHRLPQLLAALGDWLNTETAAGHIADDHHRPPDRQAALIRAALSQATGHADDLAAALNTAHNLAATLYTDGPAAPAA
jgi:hypothetical protein